MNRTYLKLLSICFLACLFCFGAKSAHASKIFQTADGSTCYTIAYYYNEATDETVEYYPVANCPESQDNPVTIFYGSYKVTSCVVHNDTTNTDILVDCVVYTVSVYSPHSTYSPEYSTAPEPLHGKSSLDPSSKKLPRPSSTSPGALIKPLASSKLGMIDQRL